MITIARTGAWFVGLAVTGVALRIAAVGDLAPPRLTALGELTAWFEATSTAATVIALVRLIAEWSVWYLLLVSGLHALATVGRGQTWRQLGDSLTPRFVRRALNAGFGLGLLATTTAVQPTGLGPAGAQIPVSAPTDDEGVDARPSPSGTATMRPFVPSSTTAAQAVAVPAAGPTAPSTTVEVSQGDSFWSLAEESLAAAWGRDPTDAEIDPFWALLIETNRHRLVDPTNPDLVLPGQVFELPPIPPPAR